MSCQWQASRPTPFDFIGVCASQRSPHGALGHRPLSRKADESHTLKQGHEEQGRSQGSQPNLEILDMPALEDVKDSEPCALPTSELIHRHGFARSKHFPTQKLVQVETLP